MLRRPAEREVGGLGAGFLRDLEEIGAVGDDLALRGGDPLAGVELKEAFVVRLHAFGLRGVGWRGRLAGDGSAIASDR